MKLDHQVNYIYKSYLRGEALNSSGSKEFLSGKWPKEGWPMIGMVGCFSRFASVYCICCVLSTGFHQQWFRRQSVGEDVPND